MPAHAASGACPGAASTNQALMCLIRGPAIHGRRKLRLDQSFPRSPDRLLECGTIRHVLVLVPWCLAAAASAALYGHQTRRRRARVAAPGDPRYQRGRRRRHDRVQHPGPRAALDPVDFEPAGDHRTCDHRWLLPAGPQRQHGHGRHECDPPDRNPPGHPQRKRCPVRHPPERQRRQHDSRPRHQSVLGLPDQCHPNAPDCIITGNFIGPGIDGTTRYLPGAPGTQVGVSLNANGCRLGGSTRAERYLVAGIEGPGVFVNPAAGSAVIEGNLIGTTRTGLATLPNHVIASGSFLGVPLAHRPRASASVA